MPKKRVSGWTDVAKEWVREKTPERFLSPAERKTYRMLPRETQEGVTEKAMASASRKRNAIWTGRTRGASGPMFGAEGPTGKALKAGVLKAGKALAKSSILNTITDVAGGATIYGAEKVRRQRRKGIPGGT